MLEIFGIELKLEVRVEVSDTEGESRRLRTAYRDSVWSVQSKRCNIPGSRSESHTVGRGSQDISPSVVISQARIVCCGGSRYGRA